MKKEIEQTIVKYLLQKLGITQKNNVSLLSNMFLLKNNISTIEDYNCMLYGVSTIVSNTKANIFCFKPESNNDVDWYLTLIKFEDLPTYALYSDNDIESYNIYVKTNTSGWMKTTTFLQATFLAGMEQINDANTYYNTANINDCDLSELTDLLKFIDVVEENYEG